MRGCANTDSRVAATTANEDKAPTVAYRVFLVTARRPADGRWLAANASPLSTQEVDDAAQRRDGLKFDR